MKPSRGRTLLTTSGALVIPFKLRARICSGSKLTGRRELADPIGGPDRDRLDRQ